MKRIFVLWALLFGILPLARAQGVGVFATLSLEEKQLLPDEKMRLKLTIENRSGRDLNLGTTNDWLTFIVLGERNTPVAPLGEDHVYIEGETNVPEGESASREFNLTPYFDFKQPGRYTVKASIKIPQWQKEVAAQERRSPSSAASGWPTSPIWKWAFRRGRRGATSRRRFATTGWKDRTPCRA